MSNREEQVAIDAVIRAVHTDQDRWVITDKVNALKQIRERLADRDYILSNLESAALEYGIAVLGHQEGIHIEAFKVTVLRRAVDLAEYDSTIHMPAKETP